MESKTTYQLIESFGVFCQGQTIRRNIAILYKSYSKVSCTNNESSYIQGCPYREEYTYKKNNRRRMNDLLTIKSNKQITKKLTKSEIHGSLQVAIISNVVQSRNLSIHGSSKKPFVNFNNTKIIKSIFFIIFALLLQ